MVPAPALVLQVVVRVHLHPLKSKGMQRTSPGDTEDALEVSRASPRDLLCLPVSCWVMTHWQSRYRLLGHGFLTLSGLIGYRGLVQGSDAGIHTGTP